MTPTRKTIDSTRPLLMASVTGAAFCSLTLATFAELPYLAGPPENVPHAQEPAYLPLPAGRPIADASGSLHLTAGQSQQTTAAQQLQPAYQQYGQPGGNTGYVQPATSYSSQGSGQPYNQNQYQQPPMPGYPMPGYPMPGYPMPGYPMPGYPMPGYPTPANQYTLPGNQPHPGQPEQKSEEKHRDSKRVGFVDRLNRLFRSGNHSDGPPVDPGMNYPKSSPPPAPGATTDLSPNPSMPSIPSIPPVVDTASQPGLFQAPSSANPIHDLVPPPPTGAPPAPGTSPAQVQATHSPKHIPELKALMESTPAVAAQPATVQVVPQTAAAPITTAPSVTTQSTAPQTTVVPPPTPEATQAAARPALPTLDLNAPMPEPAKSIAPGEPSETTASRAPASAEPKDPFNDLFPADSKTAQKETDAKPAEQPVSKPFTGLTLEAEPPVANAQKPEKSAPATAHVEAPASVQTAQSSPPAAMEAQPRLIPVEPAKPAPASAQPSETTIAEKPVLDLSVPRDLPQLSKASNSTSEMPRVEPAKIAPKLQNEEHRTKMERIAARKDRKGLKGFCPVMLRDDRELVDSSDEFSVIYNGHRYEFSSHDAMEQFLAEPAKYAPAAGGCDVLHLSLTGEELEGSLDHAVWYKGRLYLFAGVETMETFVAAPSSHAIDD